MQLLETKTGFFADYSEEIKRGAILLDAFAPGWESNISLDLLDLASGRSCVLGQVVVQNEILRKNVRLNKLDPKILDYGVLTQAFEALSESDDTTGKARLMHEVEMEAGEEYSAGLYGFVVETEWVEDQADMLCEILCTDTGKSQECGCCPEHLNRTTWGCPKQWATESNLYETLSVQWLDFIYDRLQEPVRRWEMAQLYMAAEWEDIQRSKAQARELVPV